MKKLLPIIILFTVCIINAQKKAVKKFQLQNDEIEIYTTGLDNFSIENSTSEFIEIELYAENPNKQHIVLKENLNTTILKFSIPEMIADDKIFRKYITKRLQRASAIVRIPKNKSIIIFGENINIQSKSIENKMAIFIENGILKLNSIAAKTTIKLYAGTLFANTKKSNINVASKTGNITINSKVTQENFYKEQKKSMIDFTVVTEKANIFITTK